MFCELELIELKVDTCPVKCMYRASNGECAHAALTSEEVDITAISKVTGKKVYKLKAMGAAAKQLIEIGIAVDRYSEYIRDSVPKFPPGVTAKTAETVNTWEGSSGVANKLKHVFDLTEHQQEAFWSKDRFSNWSKRVETQVTLTEMRQALGSI